MSSGPPAVEGPSRSVREFGERFCLPVLAGNHEVEIGYQVADRATEIMAVRYSAVPAAGGLNLDLLAGEQLCHLTVVPDALLDRAFRRFLPPVLHVGGEEHFLRRGNRLVVGIGVVLHSHQRLPVIYGHDLGEEG